MSHARRSLRTNAAPVRSAACWRRAIEDALIHAAGGPIRRLMSPVEVAAFYFVVPLMAIMAWFFRRYETDGAEVPEFEEWCARTRPVLIAVRCAPGSAARVRHAILKG